MAFAEHHDVVQQLPANTAHESLRRAILPRAAERGLHRSDPEPAHRDRALGGEDRIVVEDQESMSGFIREGVS
jgi:hypothetical protein